MKKQKLKKTGRVSKYKRNRTIDRTDWVEKRENAENFEQKEKT